MVLASWSVSEVIVLLTAVSHDCYSVLNNNQLIMVTVTALMSRISSIVVITNKSRDVDTSERSTDTRSVA